VSTNAATTRATPAPAGTPAELATLHELPPPPAVSYAPQTAGWAVLAIVLAACALWGAWAGWRRHRKERYRRVALAELERIEARLAQADQRGAALTAIAPLLKRTALAVAPRERVASLTGDAWLAFLRETHGRFGAQSGALLAVVSYAPAERIAAISREEAAAHVDEARDWIAHHHVEV
jgi:hypothetical protein